jgi:hypothetical protein
MASNIRSTVEARELISPPRPTNGLEQNAHTVHRSFTLNEASWSQTVVSIEANYRVKQPTEELVHSLLYIRF